MLKFMEIIEEFVRSSQMDLLTIIFATTALILFLLFIVSFTIFGLWLSEIGLWLAPIPLSLVIVAIPIMIGMHSSSEVSAINLFFMTIGSVTNLISFIGLILPFVRVNKTNEKLRKAMEACLGKNYLKEIDPRLYVRIFKKVKFKLIHYFLGLKLGLRRRIIVHKDITYKQVGNTQLQLDIYRPRRSGNFPVIIYIHGGGWIMGSKDSAKQERVGALLANYGYVVFSINYRLYFPEATCIDEMVSDVRAAIKFVKQNAPAFYGDPDNIFLFGRSAGGHLALLTGLTKSGPFFKEEWGEYTEKDLEVAGVIAFYPVTNIERFYDSWRILASRIHFFEKVVGGKPGEARELYRFFSPINYLDQQNANEIPPIFLVTGSMDKLVTPDQSKELFKALQKRKATSVLIELPWANHSFDTMLSGPGGQLTYKYLTQFLAWALSKKRRQEIDLKRNIISSFEPRIVSKERLELWDTDLSRWEQERSLESSSASSPSSSFL